jgi:hypothetical protein
MDTTGKFGYLTGGRALPYKTYEERDDYYRLRFREIMAPFKDRDTSCGCQTGSINSGCLSRCAYKEIVDLWELLDQELDEIDECIRRVGSGLNKF